MKTKIILFFCCYSVYFMGFSQSFTMELSTSDLLLLAERSIKVAQQEGLLSDAGVSIDSLRISRWNEHFQDWQGEAKKYFYYNDNQLIKSNTLLRPSPKMDWQKGEAAHFHYENDEMDFYEIQQNQGNTFVPHQKGYLQHNPEGQFVKEKRLLWDATTKTWQQHLIFDVSYYPDGKRAGLKSAQFLSEQQDWQEKDYRLYIYKPDEVWLQEEYLMLWQEAAQTMKKRYGTAYVYSGNILKRAVHQVWNQENRQWDVFGKTLFHYSAMGALEKLAFQRLDEEDEAWIDVAQCEFSWEEQDVLLTSAIAINQPIHLRMANPYVLGENILVEGLDHQKEYWIELYDVLGNLTIQKRLTGNIFSMNHLKAAGTYFLTIKNKKGEVVKVTSIVIKQ